MNSTTESSMDCSRKFILVFIMAFCAIQSTAQEEVQRDNELWTGFSAKYKLSKKIQFGLEQQVRINDNLRNLKSNFFELGARYKWNKHFSVKFQYRYTLRTDLRNVNRYSLDVKAKWKIKPLKLHFTYRPRFQHSAVVYTLQPASYFRNKLTLEFEGWKKITPFASYENFYKLNEHNEFRGNRYIIGMNAKLGKQLDLKAFYGIDQEINKSQPSRRNIVALLLSYSF